MRKEGLNAIIIGAGGGASYLLPALMKTFNAKGTIVDGDVLEEHNLDRQLFDDHHIGDNKAEALIYCSEAYSFKSVPKFLDDALVSRLAADEEPDIVIACVDNHPARNKAIDLACRFLVPAVVTANEYFTAQTLFMNPRDPETSDPRKRYPEIATDRSGDPTGCQGEEQESNPQLASSNMVSAAMAMHFIALYFLSGMKPEHITFRGAQSDFNGFQNE